MIGERERKERELGMEFCNQADRMNASKLCAGKCRNKNQTKKCRQDRMQAIIRVVVRRNSRGGERDRRLVFRRWERERVCQKGR